MLSMANLVVLVLTATLALYYLHRKVSTRNFPPGPKPLPLLGNIFDIPLSREHQVYEKLAKVYGDVIHVSALGKHIVVLNGIQSARDVLDMRSAIYSDRPYIPMLHEPDLMDVRWGFVFSSYMSTWRRQRRLFVNYISPGSAHMFFDAQISSTHTLLRSLLKSPEQFLAHFCHMATETIMAIAYGYQMKPGDPWVELADRTVKHIADGTSPSIFLVNVLPWLRHMPAWLPGAGFRTFAAKIRRSAQAMIDTPFENARTRMADGTAFPSFVTSALADSPSDPLAISDIKNVAATMYGDTTVSAVQSCILGLVLNPSIQIRAQAELDAVLGSVTASTFRLPTFEDRKYCPYLDAIVKESLRWLPVSPMAVPHATSADDVYRGWQIPKGSIVMPNVWAMLHNEETYPEPYTFRPERYLGEDPAPHPGDMGCFGFGRRDCPGRALAENSIWIQIASVLAAFTLSSAKDAEGRDIDVTYACDPPPGFLIFPRPFPCTITPRSQEAEMRIRETHPQDE